MSNETRTFTTYTLSLVNSSVDGVHTNKEMISMTLNTDHGFGYPVQQLILAALALSGREELAEPLLDILIGQNPNYEIVSKGPYMKQFHVQEDIGESKYVVSHHDGDKTYPDGSPFFDITIFRDKKNLAVFIKNLRRNGYTEV